MVLHRVIVMVVLHRVIVWWSSKGSVLVVLHSAMVVLHKLCWWSCTRLHGGPAQGYCVGGGPSTGLMVLCDGGPPQGYCVGGSTRLLYGGPSQGYCDGGPIFMVVLHRVIWWSSHGGPPQGYCVGGPPQLLCWWSSTGLL